MRRRRYRSGGGIGIMGLSKKGQAHTPTKDSSDLARLMARGVPSSVAAKLVRGGLLRRARGGVIGFQEGGATAPAGYGQSTQLNVRSEQLNPAVASQFGQVKDKIMKAGEAPLKQFGPGVAGFTGMEAAAQAGYGAYGTGAGPQGTQQAQSTLDQAARGTGSMIPGYQAAATQYGNLASTAMDQGQASAQGMQDLAGRAEMQGQLAGSGMRQTGAAAQAQQGALGQAQMEAGQAGQAQMAELGQGIQDQAATAAGRMRAIGETGPELGKSADMSGYMSQYTENVTDPQLQQLIEFQKQQGQELGSQAAGAGAFGGYRQGIMAGQQAQDAAQQAASIIGQGQQDAFQSAIAREQEDARRVAAGQQLGLSAEQQAAASQAGAQGQMLSAQQAGIGMGMQGLQDQRAAATQGTQFDMQGQQQGYQAANQGTQQGLQGLQAAQQAAAQGFSTTGDMLQGQQGAMGREAGAYSQLANIGGQQMALGANQQTQQLQRLDAMNRAGQGQRQLTQSGLDYQRAQHEQQQQYDMQQAAWMNSQLGALPYQSTVTQASYNPEVGAASNLMGLGAKGLAAYKQWMNRNQGAVPTGPVVPPVD